MKVEPGFINDRLIDWLLAGDVAIQYQVYRDLLDEERPDLRARIALEGWGASSWPRVGLKATGAGGFTSPSGSRPITPCST